jgi:hypothetical protein
MPNHQLLDLEDLITDFDPQAPAVDRVRTAQALIQAAIDVLQDVVRETKDDNAEAYVVDHLRILAARGHGFLDRSMNIDDWIDRLENGDEGEDEDEDE